MINVMQITIGDKYKDDYLSNFQKQLRVLENNGQQIVSVFPLQIVGVGETREVVVILREGN